MKLTESQRRLLESMVDSSDGSDLVTCRHLADVVHGDPNLVGPTARTLGSLDDKGLVEYVRVSQCARLTAAGREAVSRG